MLHPGLRLALAALFALSCPAAAGEAFFEDFARLDEGRWMVSDGWTNGDWMNCGWSREAVAVADGILTLRIEQSHDTAGAILCGEIQSLGQFGHGTYEVRMRSPAGSGLNAAFFTYIGPVHGRAHHEVDVEILLRDPSRATFNTFVEGRELNGGRAALAGPGDEGFHTYAFTWTPEGITWFVDGVAAHRTAPGTALPEAPQKIYASLWSSDSFPDWMGPFDASALPAVLDIDWIAFTPLGQSCAFPASILCGAGR
ncbi:family 16 glycosylhydrolase [Roseibacterium sp. SDUM158016]|uniref:family 16 glycosylhydrolase n=1 Tax=Roseicyclus sediminis TaxID=2980997 RepID=UPI0021CE3E16|nr:family 16 glycosylhydrolase [Roseibacterium sp. SDUM158016]MCU4654386.1 family 16 glycosylhydrolase [Roseibacterium sp. SDUM158016]